jgi:hypothetical protein
MINLTVKCGLPACLVLAGILAACETKSAGRARANEAYLAGRLSAERAAAQNAKLEVTVHGEVTRNQVPWTRDLTLARAIVAAGYTSILNPGAIDVIRNGVTTRVSPRQLLRGEDLNLEPGDLVEIRPISEVH